MKNEKNGLKWGIQPNIKLTFVEWKNEHFDWWKLKKIQDMLVFHSKRKILHYLFRLNLAKICNIYIYIYIYIYVYITHMNLNSNFKTIDKNYGKLCKI